MRTVAPRRATVGVLLVAYWGLVALWIYTALRNADSGLVGTVVGVGTTVVGILLGAYGRSWWLALAPIAAPFFAIPAGDWDYPGTEFPVWYATLIALPWLALSIAIGVAFIKLRERRAARRRQARSR